MKMKIFLISIIIMIIIIPTALSLEWSSDLLDWDFRNEINVQNNFSINMVGASIRISAVNDIQGFDASNFNSNGDDIVITDDANKNMSYFVELWNIQTGDTVIWFNASINANSNRSYFIYYGNSEAVKLAENTNFMSDYQNLTSNVCPQGWVCTNLFFDTTDPISPDFSMGISDGGDRFFSPVLPPSSNYTIDFYYRVTPCQKCQLQEAGAGHLKWNGVSNAPNIQFNCLNSSLENPSSSFREGSNGGKWARMVFKHDRTNFQAEIKLFLNESLKYQCLGNVSAFGNAQTRSGWSIQTGNSGAGKGVYDNWKVYKNFVTNTSEVTVVSSSLEFNPVTEAPTILFPLDNSVFTTNIIDIQITYSTLGITNILYYIDDVLNTISPNNITIIFPLIPEEKTFNLKVGITDGVTFGVNNSINFFINLSAEQIPLTLANYPYDTFLKFTIGILMIVLVTGTVVNLIRGKK